MGKTVVIFKSKCGHTKKYAEWISADLNGDLIEVSKAKIEEILEYDTIVFGGGIYASGISGVSCITKNFEKLKNKKIIVFTVGLTKTDDLSVFKPIIDKNFTPEMQSKMKFFHLRGGMDYNKLNFFFKAMMSMLKKSVEKKPVKTEEDEELLATFGGNADYSNKNTIEPLVSYVKSIQ